jgi:hypothetical protein
MRFAIIISLLGIPTSTFAQSAIIDHLNQSFENACGFVSDYNSPIPDINLEDAFSYLTLGDEEEITATVFNPMLAKCGDKDAQLCGTRGCEIIIEVDKELYHFTGWTPKVIKVNGVAMMLLPHSGWMCDDALPNNAPCYTIATWDENAKKLNYITPR